MENLNVEQIKKALKDLMYEAYTTKGAHKPYLTMRDALALITSQEQRIKELEAETERLESLCVSKDIIIGDLSKENERLKEDNEIATAERIGENEN